MIHNIIDVREKKYIQFTTNISRAEGILPVRWDATEPEEDKILYTGDGECTIGELIEALGGMQEMPQPLHWMAKDLTIEGNWIVLMRRGEEIARYSIRKQDRLFEINVDRFPEILPVSPDTIVSFGGFVKSHGRVRVYYRGVKND